jgi:hypothetical protein
MIDIKNEIALDDEQSSAYQKDREFTDEIARLELEESKY